MTHQYLIYIKFATFKRVLPNTSSGDKEILHEHYDGTENYIIIHLACTLYSLTYCRGGTSLTKDMVGLATDSSTMKLNTDILHKINNNIIMGLNAIGEQSLESD